MISRLNICYICYTHLCILYKYNVRIYDVVKMPPKFWNDLMLDNIIHMNNTRLHLFEITQYNVFCN